MNQSPSHEELKDDECFYLELRPDIAVMNDTFDVSIEDQPISSFLFYESSIASVEDGFDFPYQKVRINISEQSSDDTLSFSGKYPVGFVRFYDGSATFTLMARSELVSRMISTLGMVKDHELEFLLTLPALPSPLPNVYPVLNYQYRVRSSFRNNNL